MIRTLRSRTSLAAGAIAVGLVLAGCGADDSETTPDAAADPADPGSGTVTIEDDFGVQEVPEAPQSIVVTDNRSFRTLERFGVELTGAPLGLARETSYGEQDLHDLGSHREPDFEALIAAQPDLVINGQRFGQYYDDIAELVPEATIVQLDEATTDPATYFDGLVEKTEQLGVVFGEEDAAQQIIDEFTTERERVAAAYDGESSVIAVLTSGGSISYAAPGDGRTLGPLFTEFGFTPAIEQTVEDESHGDDISVEAIADADPDWLLVMDRDAMNRDEDEDYQPAQELLADSPALQEVTAVQEGNIVYMPDNTYLTEDIFTYTEYFADLADAMESAQ